MQQLFYELKNFFRKGDMVLLVMCLSISAFGCLVIASTNNYRGFLRYVLIQVLAIALGVLVFAVMSSIDVEFFSEHRAALVIFSLGLLALLIPFGTDLGSGNKSWLDLPLIPIYIQPAEICKIFYILITASVMNSHQTRISSFGSVFHMGFYLILLVGTLVSFVVSLLVIKALMEYVRKRSFAAFGYYRIVLGFLVIGYFLIKSLVTGM